MPSLIQQVIEGLDELELGETLESVPMKLLMKKIGWQHTATYFRRVLRMDDNMVKLREAGYAVRGVRYREFVSAC